jgi:hypothetical protein
MSKYKVAPLTAHEATTARLDLLSAYTMTGGMEADGLPPSSVRAWLGEAAPVAELPVREDEGYFYKEPGEDLWSAA